MGQDRKALAIYLQNQISVTFGVDIHPAARVMALWRSRNRYWIAETAIVENDVSILQSVTLGGTGKLRRSPS